MLLWAVMFSFKLMACETLRWILRWDFTVLCHSRLIALGPVRIRIPFLVRTLTALAILFLFLLLFLFSFSIFLHFLPSRLSSLPFLQSDVPRMAKTAGDSLAALLAEKPKLHRSAAEAQSNLSRTLGAPFELVRSGSGFSWSSAATACGLSCAKASEWISFWLFTFFVFVFVFVFYLCIFFVRSVCSQQSCRALQSLQVLRKFRGDNKSATSATKGNEEGEEEAVGGEGVVEKVRTLIADCALVLCVCVCLFTF